MHRCGRSCYAVVKEVLHLDRMRGRGFYELSSSFSTREHVAAEEKYASISRTRWQMMGL